MVVAISDPIATSATATSASATTTSMSVKPSTARRRSKILGRNNLDTSGEPIDADLEAPAQPRQRDRAPAGSARRKKVDRRPHVAPIAPFGEERLNRNVVRQAHRAAG